MAQTMQSMRDMVAAEVERQKRYKRITDYLRKAKEAKSVGTIVQMFPDTSEKELAEMARLSLISYIPRGKYTVFNISKTHSA